MRSGGVEFGRHAGDRERHYGRYFRGAKAGEFCKLPDKLRRYSTGEREGRLHCRQRQISIRLEHDAFLLWRIEEGKPIPDDHHNGAASPSGVWQKKCTSGTAGCELFLPPGLSSPVKTGQLSGRDQSDGSFHLSERRFIRRGRAGF